MISRFCLLKNAELYAQLCSTVLPKWGPGNLRRPSGGVSQNRPSIFYLAQNDYKLNLALYLFVIQFPFRGVSMRKFGNRSSTTVKNLCSRIRSLVFTSKPLYYIYIYYKITLQSEIDK